MSRLPTTINYKGYKIPTGTSKKDEADRRKIINDFYRKWFQENEEKRVKNTSLGTLIHVNKDSRKETQKWGSLSFRSTLTVLELSYVLKNAVVTGKDDPKPGNKSQKKYSKMLIMECVVPKLRPYVVTAKLTVGVRRSDSQRLQYCLTAK